MATLVFVDFETTICDIDSCLLTLFAKTFPGAENVDLKQRKHCKLADNFTSHKLKAKMMKLQDQPGIVEQSKPYSHAIAALHEMRSFGLNVFIVCTSHLVQEKLAWVEKHVGKDWRYRCVITHDKSILASDSILIDANPSPWEGCVLQEDRWKHVLYTQPYNAELKHSNRLLSWDSWKIILSLITSHNSNERQRTLSNELSEIKAVAWFRHGSEDSRDIDKMYLVECWPDNNRAINSFVSGAGEDRNIIMVNSEGYVIKCYKGIPDEVNNGLLHTYSLHSQEFPLPIKRRCMRSVVTRVVVALRAVLVKFRRVAKVREVVVHALESFDFQQRRKALNNISLQSLASDITSEDVKYIAFQLGQTLALINGEEIFTKRALVSAFPTLQKFIYPESYSFSSTELQQLDDLKSRFCSALEGVITIKKGSIHYFYCTDNFSANHFTIQCNGTVVDLQQERLLYMGPLLKPAQALPVPQFCQSQQEFDENQFESYYVGLFEQGDSLWFTSSEVLSSAKLTKIKAAFNKVAPPTKLLSNLKLKDIFPIFVITDEGPKLTAIRFKDSLRLSHDVSAFSWPPT